MKKDIFLNQTEVVISDDDLILDRKEADQKLQRLKFYYSKVNSRIRAINRQLEKMRDPSSKEDIKKGLEAFNLDSDVSELK